MSCLLPFTSFRSLSGHETYSTSLRPLHDRSVGGQDLPALSLGSWDPRNNYKWTLLRRFHNKSLIQGMFQETFRPLVRILIYKAFSSRKGVT